MRSSTILQYQTGWPVDYGGIISGLLCACGRHGRTETSLKDDPSVTMKKQEAHLAYESY